MTAGGRWRGSRPHPVAIQRRTPAATRSACVTESFDTADTSTVGPDQSWITHSYVGGGTARIRGNALALAGSASGSIKKTHLRCEADVSADMKVSAVVSQIGDPGDLSTQTWGVFARMNESGGDPTDFTNGDLVGWLFTVTYDSGDWLPFLEEAYYDEGFSSFTGIDSAASYQNGTGFNSGTPITALAEGDTISITVTGSGSSTRVVCAVNDTTLLDAAGNTLAQMNFYPGSGDPSGQYATWAMATNAAGARGGVMLGATCSGTWSSTQDDQVRLDDFSVCPA